MTSRARPRTPAPLFSATILASLVFAMAGATGAGAVGANAAVPAAAVVPAIAAAVTAIPASPSPTSVEGYLLTWVNADRAALGLRPLRLDGRLRAVARTRAATLATLGILSHTAPGDLSAQLAAAGVQRYAWGEDIGWTSYAWGLGAARSLYSMWKASPEHWTILTNATYNSVGFGLGYRPSGGATYGSAVLTESSDQTAPAARMTSASRIGTTVRFTWTGAEISLQTPTAGFVSFDLLYRASNGVSRVIRSGTTATAISIASRPGGHSYYLSVRARDRAGNVSPWSAPLHVWVP